MNSPPNLLVLCTGNSCRSQMAHGYLQKFLADRANVYSAGVETHGLNPRAVEIMAEDGVDIAHHTSNHVDDYADVPFDCVITVCDHARERCPYFPTAARMLHRSFTDPAKATGTPAEIRHEFRRVRDDIKAFAREFADRFFTTPATPPLSTPA